MASAKVYQAALSNNRVKLERALPMSRLVTYLHPVGLMRDTNLSQKLNDPGRTDIQKAGILLNWLDAGLGIGNTASFEKFMRAMESFATDNGDDTVAFLLNELQKDLTREPGEPTSGGGPTFPSKVPTLGDLFTYLDDVDDWYKFGSHLLPADSQGKLDTIRRSNKDNVDDCKRDLYSLYFRVGNVSWDKVVEALQKAGYPNIVKKIKT